MATATKLDWTYYGLAVYETDDGEQYAVGTDEQAQAACEGYIRETLWSFNAVWIVTHMSGELNCMAVATAIRAIQGTMCEDCNEVIRRLLGDDIEYFIRDSILADGRGHFLASYDGEEDETERIECLPPGLFAYRLN